jgi:hypothetical protein
VTRHCSLSSFLTGNRQHSWSGWQSEDLRFGEAKPMTAWHVNAELINKLVRPAECDIARQSQYVS